ncbi:MAG: hypothetical protein ACYS0E_01925 [Planctomycetota bacterium]
MRYIFTSVLVIGAFAAALYLRSDATPAVAGTETAEILEQRPDVTAAKVEGGTEVTIRYRFAGSCSRAKVVYRHEGTERVLASTTDCRRSLSQDGKVENDGYLHEVELSGTIPTGASDVRLILESETGTRIARVEL